jgi:hypothetical protein
MNVECDAESSRVGSCRVTVEGDRRELARALGARAVQFTARIPQRQQSLANAAIPEGGLELRNGQEVECAIRDGLRIDAWIDGHQVPMEPPVQATFSFSDGATSRVFPVGKPVPAFSRVINSQPSPTPQAKRLTWWRMGVSASIVGAELTLGATPLDLAFIAGQFFSKLGGERPPQKPDHCFALVPRERKGVVRFERFDLPRVSTGNFLPDHFERRLDLDAEQLRSVLRYGVKLGTEDGEGVVAFAHPMESTIPAHDREPARQVLVPWSYGETVQETKREPKVVVRKPRPAVKRLEPVVEQAPPKPVDEPGARLFPPAHRLAGLEPTSVMWGQRERKAIEVLVRTDGRTTRSVKIGVIRDSDGWTFTPRNASGELVRKQTISLDAIKASTLLEVVDWLRSSDTSDALMSRLLSGASETLAQKRG